MSNLNSSSVEASFNQVKLLSKSEGTVSKIFSALSYFHRIAAVVSLVSLHISYYSWFKDDL